MQEWVREGLAMREGAGEPAGKAKLAFSESTFQM